MDIFQTFSNDSDTTQTDFKRSERIRIVLAKRLEPVGESTGDIIKMFNGQGMEWFLQFNFLQNLCGLRKSDRDYVHSSDFVIVGLLFDLNISRSRTL